MRGVTKPMTDQTTFFIWNDESITDAAKLLKAGEVVAFPTETVYGLGADATNPVAVAKIFEAKGRPSDNPLIVHVANEQQISRYVTTISSTAKQLIAAFMPGPLTIILPSNGTIADNVTAGLGTVGIRIPDHPAARALIAEADLPIAAPSANLSGKTSPTSAIHVFQDLNGKIAGILDGGQTGVGVESTVIDCTSTIPRILRPGGVTRAQMEAVLGQAIEDAYTESASMTPIAPGMKYKHYEPDVPLILVDGEPTFFQEQIDMYQKDGKKVGALVSEELAPLIRTDQLQMCGSTEDLTTVAAQLYQSLRAFKATEVDLILAEFFPEEGVGQAIMNRLKKAASYIEIQSDQANPL